MNYEWKEKGQSFYYFIKEDGRIVGKVSYLFLSSIYIAVVYTDQHTFSVDNEKQLGYYIDMQYAKDAVRNYWVLGYQL